MRSLNETDVREAFVNVDSEDLRLLKLPPDFILIDWDYLDFYAWRDPETPKRGYILVEDEGHLVGVALRSTGPGRVRSGMCNICHTMQPGNQISLFSARRAGEAGRRGDSVGTYMCDDLSCHDNVRLAHPLAPNEVRAPGQVDMRLDGTRRRIEAFVGRVFDPISGGVSKDKP